MRHLYKLLLALLLLPNLVLAQQNLVPNWSFEDTTHCPVVADTIFCEGWHSCGLSPDYYNSCANSLQSSFGVPSNWYGYQQPVAGAAYVGLGTFSTGAQYPLREFAGTKLTQALTSGARYYISGYISRGHLNSGDCSTNKFGFRFFTQPLNYLNPAPVDNFAHVYSDVVVTDTAGWFKVQGSFVADSAYEYLVSGNFFDDAQTTITGCNTSQSVVSYYYLDNVCVSTDSLTCEVTTTVSPQLPQPIFSIAPNPAHDVLNIYASSFTGVYQLSIFNLQGQEVTTQLHINKPQAQLPIGHLSPGLLFIRITYQDQSYLFKHLKQ